MITRLVVVAMGGGVSVAAAKLSTSETMLRAFLTVATRPWLMAARIAAAGRWSSAVAANKELRNFTTFKRKQPNYDGFS